MPDQDLILTVSGYQFTVNTANIIPWAGYTVESLSYIAFLTSTVMLTYNCASGSEVSALPGHCMQYIENILQNSNPITRVRLPPFPLLGTYISIPSPSQTISSTPPKSATSPNPCLPQIPCVIEAKNSFYTIPLIILLFIIAPFAKYGQVWNRIIHNRHINELPVPPLVQTVSDLPDDFFDYVEPDCSFLDTLKNQLEKYRTITAALFSRVLVWFKVNLKRLPFLFWDGAAAIPFATKILHPTSISSRITGHFALPSWKLRFDLLSRTGETSCYWLRIVWHANICILQRVWDTWDRAITIRHVHTLSPDILALLRKLKLVDDTSTTEFVLGSSRVALVASNTLAPDDATLRSGPKIRALFDASLELDRVVKSEDLFQELFQHQSEARRRA